MDVFNLSLWPLWCACALLLIAAIVNLRSLLAPNWLSFGGGILPSVGATAVAFLLLAPFYQSGWLGAGCIKMQMAFGAWVGCAVGLPAAVLVTAFATIAGALFTAIGALYATLQLRSREGVGVGAHLFPAQVTLSLGSVCGVAAAGLIGWI
jgi:Flp pilus assembly protein protease CpaA